MIKQFCSFLVDIFSRNAICRRFARFVIGRIKFKKDMIIRVGDLRMCANTVDRVLALLLYKYNFLENYEMQLARSTVGEGMIVLDIGANIGYYSASLAKLVGTTGMVYAFEPDPDNYGLLSKNMKINDIKNVIPIQKAVADITGFIKLYLSYEHRGDHQIYATAEKRVSIEIESVALDDFFKENLKVDFIKMDVQGAEMLVLLGMEKIIRNNKNLKIICEFWLGGLRNSGFSGDEFLNKVRECGFGIYFIDEEKNCTMLMKENCDILQKCIGDKQLNLFLKR